MKQQRILVTGGTSGIGREVVGQLAAAGQSVVTTGRDEARLAEVGALDQVTALQADFTDPSTAARVIAESVELLGGLDVVVANAGVQHLQRFTGPEANVDQTEVEGQIDLNLTSIVMLAAAAMSELERSSGLFSGVSSGLAYAPKKGSPVYCATKAGLHTFLDALRYQAEDEGRGVAIQEVVMPLVVTPMTEGRNDGAMEAADAAKALVEGLEHRKDRVFVGKARLVRPLLRLAPSILRRSLRDS